ncbi:FAD-binding and (Fe-S)-binding domain-containing protein [Candidatus Desulfovibrio trichonymphae]|uniref:Putative FAD-dependent oxidoreductase n=1 Tax=Candidatus Desulfovibrio trichonymphae TaxID=1725232 RepID=A0A1J1DQC9_9BACT|nr:FAD-binding and (Fe-S)-binding domain-containing protein [Candidatus Desulfovibrio trichonymphae]BAV92018.1 putative FAD-dependent oxidoreductase [Candidatus Desulfovibrio trichonymphae]
MPHKGPHISIPPNYVVNRILRINIDDFAEWPQSVRLFAIAIAEELFLVACNPFIDVDIVRESVQERFERESLALAHYYATAVGEGITMFWSAHEAELEFRDKLIEALRNILPAECVLSTPSALVSAATDATDLRMELPLLVVEPDSTEQVAAIVKLANELKFALIPRGGGSGLTGGAVPARKRTVIVSLTRLTRIGNIDLDGMTVVAQAGAITQDVINAAGQAKTLFTVDPASKQASSIGGNISENAGGPSAFEYGTTLDNLLWWRMVTPTGEIITVEREDHPRHKILPDETAVFVVKDVSGGVRNVIHLRGDEIRLPDLGKDVTNKALGGLPGMQKEGVDGIVTEAAFILHKKPLYNRVMVLEFFGRSMHPAAVVVRELVNLRNRIREEGDYALLSALEEFSAKYVQAIEYKRKSNKFNGLPISVIILQVDGDDPYLLDKCVGDIVKVVENQENVDIVVAADDKEADRFWEDRHRLSAIAKRTSGFKLNEDVVMPTDRIPDFALFLEQLNLEYTAAAFRHALQEVGRLPGFPMEDKNFNREFSFASKAASGDVPATDLSDTELFDKATRFLNDLSGKHPHLAKKIDAVAEYMEASRIVVASHMHAGDGNWHVNIPVNSNDARMLEEAEEAAAKVMAACQEMGGEVSGEHGIGITKIAFFSKDKMDALRAFKERVDPRDVMNPAKLVYRELPVRPFTFSFNRLIRDIHDSGLSDKEKLISLLTSVQICTRCGKCKQVCPMSCPERSMHYHPRNKNMVLGMLLEAVYYSQVNKGRIDENLLAALRDLVEHCTSCGRCTANCPISIPSGEVALSLRALLEHEGAGGHPLKTHALEWMARDVRHRVPKAAKMASLGQKMQNRAMGFVPQIWKKRMQNPLFSGHGPKIGYSNLYETLKLHRGSIFAPAEPIPGMPCALYFPGCGGALFYDRISVSSIMLLLKAGLAVAVPSRHMCCGYPLLAAGMDTAFEDNMAQNRLYLATMLRNLDRLGFDCRSLVSACGTCRDSLGRHELTEQFPNLVQQDVTQLALPLLDKKNMRNAPEAGTNIVCHTACHCEWAGVHKVKGRQMIADALTDFSGAAVSLSLGCCAESGMGAMTSPQIFNVLRERKQAWLQADLAGNDATPVLVGCPSCKIGIGRCLINMGDKRPVLHTAEWLAGLIDGEDRRQSFRKKINETREEVRVVKLEYCEG